MVTGGGGFLGRDRRRSSGSRRTGGHLRAAFARLRPAPPVGDRPRDRRWPAGRHHPPRRRRRRHRGQPREPGPLLLRERDHGHRAHRGRAGRRDREVRDGRHGVRVSEVHARAVSRGRPLGWLPRGDQRAVRTREEDAPRPGPVVSGPVRDGRRLPDPGQPLRTGRQLRSSQLPCHPGPHQEVRRRPRGERAVHRGLGDRDRLARVPVRG